MQICLQASNYAYVKCVRLWFSEYRLRETSLLPNPKKKDNLRCKCLDRSILIISWRIEKTNVVLRVGKGIQAWHNVNYRFIAAVWHRFNNCQFEFLYLGKLLTRSLWEKDIAYNHSRSFYRWFLNSRASHRVPGSHVGPPAWNPWHRFDSENWAAVWVTICGANRNGMYWLRSGDPSHHPWTRG